MPVEVAVTVPYSQGKAQVRMLWTEGNRNRTWLHQAIGTRRPEYVREEKHWLIPRTAARRVYDAATADLRSATLTHVFRPETETCT